MKKIFLFSLLSVFVLFLNISTSWSCSGSRCSASAGANSASSSNLDATVTSSNNNANTNVNVVEGGGGGSASATGGTAVNYTTVAPNISPQIGVDVGVNPNQTVAPQQGQEQKLSIDDHSVNKYINRQLPGMPLVGGPEKMEYFGPWQLPQTPWNVIPPEVGKFSIKGNMRRINYKKLWENIYQSFDPVEYVTQVPWGSVKTGGMEEVGELAVVLNESQASQDGLQIARYKASQNGADLIEFIIGWNQKASTGGWHVGTGMGASGVVGPNEKVGLSGAGGTGVGRSYVEVNTLPFVKVRMWHTGGITIEMKSKPPIISQKSQLRNHVEEKYETTKNK